MKVETANRLERLAELFGSFLDELDKAPQVDWWGAFYGAVPEAARLVSEAERIVKGRPLKELTTEELLELEPLATRYTSLATAYAADRGEKVPPLPTDT